LPLLQPSKGNAALLIEVQALVTQSVYGTPQRTVSGLTKALAIVVSRAGKAWRLSFWCKRCFLNIAGGLKVEDPSIDLAVLCALLSSLKM
jgi:DNA repair protein RadA/Sms